MTAHPILRSFRTLEAGPLTRSLIIGATILGILAGPGSAQDQAPPAAPPGAAGAAAASADPFVDEGNGADDAAEAPRAEAGEGRRFNGLEDARGLPWGVTSHGVLGLTSGCIAKGMVLAVDGKPFAGEAEEESLSPERARYRLEGSAGGVRVVRDVLVDLERGGARFLDVVELAEGVEEGREVEVRYATALGGGVAGIRTSGGEDLAQGMKPTDYGIVAGFDGSGGESSAVFVVAGTSDSLRPAVVLADGTLTFTYTLALEPGRPRALLHWVAQRPGTPPQDLARWFDDFYRRGRHLGADVPAETAPLIANFAPGSTNDEGFFAPFAGRLAAVAELQRRLGCEREDEDLLWVSADSQLRGTLSGESVRITSATFGGFDVPLTEIAAIQGGGGRGMEHRVFLRDGHVLAGTLEARGLKLTGGEGWSIEIDIDRLEALLTRLGRGDGVPPAGEGTLAAALHSGDVVVGSPDPGGRLSLVTPWGSLDVPVASIAFAAYLKLPSPRYRVLLADGSRLSAFVDGPPLAIESARLGTVSIGPSQVGMLWPAETAAPSDTLDVLEEAEDILELGDLPGELPAGVPLCLLKGGNLVVAEIAMPEITLASGVAVTAIAPSEILTLQRNEDETGSEVVPGFVLQLAGGDMLRGPLKESVVRLRTSHGEWDVPVQHLLAFRSADAR